MPLRLKSNTASRSRLITPPPTTVVLRVQAHNARACHRELELGNVNPNCPVVEFAMFSLTDPSKSDVIIGYDSTVIRLRPHNSVDSRPNKESRGVFSISKDSSIVVYHIARCTVIT